MLEQPTTEVTVRSLVREIRKIPCEDAILFIFSMEMSLFLFTIVCSAGLKFLCPANHFSFWTLMLHGIKISQGVTMIVGIFALKEEIHRNRLLRSDTNTQGG